MLSHEAMPKMCTQNGILVSIPETMASSDILLPLSAKIEFTDAAYIKVIKAFEQKRF